MDYEKTLGVLLIIACIAMVGYSMKNMEFSLPSVHAPGFVTGAFSLVTANPLIAGGSSIILLIILAIFWIIRGDSQEEFSVEDTFSEPKSPEPLEKAEYTHLKEAQDKGRDEPSEKETPEYINPYSPRQSFQKRQEQK